MTDHSKSSRLELLRKKAEAAVSEVQSVLPGPDSDKVRFLIHELKVYQTELEMQNEELASSQIKLERSRDLYSLLFHRAPAGYLIVNENGMISKANDTLAEITGIDTTSLENTPLSAIIHPDDRNLFYSRFRAFFKSPEEKIMELRLLGSKKAETYVKLEGRIVDSDIFGCAHSNGKGKLLITVSDITWLVKTRAELKERNAMLELAMEAARLGFWTWDISTGILDFSGRMAEMFGRGSAGRIRVNKKNILRFIHPEDSKKTGELLDKFFDSATREAETEFRVMTSSGEWRWIFSRGRLIENVRGETSLILTGVSMDVTERKNIEEERRVTERKAVETRRMASLRLMAGAIAHHFNNKIMCIIGNLEMASSARGKWESNGYVKDAINSAWDSAELGRLMIIYTGTAFSEKTRTDISCIAGNVIAVLNSMMPPNVKLVAEIKKPTTDVMADTSQIIHALMFLIDNAIDSLPLSGGSITVRVAEYLCSNDETCRLVFSPDSDDNGACVAIEVTDSGCGMAEEVLSTAFDPFFSTKGLGRGMGLPLVLGITKAHEGKIAIESSPGEGTRVRLLLPALHDSAPLTEKKYCPEPGDQFGTIILIEGNAHDRRTSAAFLHHSGCDVIPCRTIAEGFAFFSEKKDAIRCVIVNHSDLTDAAARVLEMSLPPSIPLVCMTSVDPDYTRSSISPGAWLLKPLTVKGVRKTIRKVLSIS